MASGSLKFSRSGSSPCVVQAALLQERAHGAVLHEVVLPAQHALEVRVGDAQPRERVGQAGASRGGDKGAGSGHVLHPWQVLPWSLSAQRPASAHEAHVERAEAFDGSPSNRPTTAVTLFVGTSRLPAVAARPMRRGASSAARNAGCTASGRSPKPGL